MPGNYNVGAYTRPNGGANVYIGSETVAVEADVTTPIHFDAHDVTGLLKGTFKLNGQPTDGQIQFCEPEDPCSFSASDGPLYVINGNYNIALAPGDYIAHAKYVSGNESTEIGSYPITVVSGFMQTIKFTNDPIVSEISDATINEGQTYSVNGSFTDTDSASWSATVNYGDGSGTQPLTLNGTTFSLSHVYQNPGQYTVTVEVSDMEGGVGSDSTTVTVNALPTATPTPTYILGFNSKGTTLSNGSHDYMNGSKYTTGSVGGNTDTISVYAGTIGNATHRNYQLGIYTTKTNGKPGTLVANTVTGTLTANSWNTLPISATLSANTTYWLMYNNNGQNDSVNNMYYSTGTSNIGAYASRTFGSWPTNFPSPDMGNWKYSIYVTYH